MPYEIINATTGLSSIPEGTGIIVTIVVFLGILGIIFLLSRNFRQFIYGGIVTAFLFGLVSLFLCILKLYNNFIPLKYFGYIGGFIIISIILGRILLSFKFMKRFEYLFGEEEKKNEHKHNR